MLPRKSGARRQGGSVREGSPFEKKIYFFKKQLILNITEAFYYLSQINK
jgi:hypothetical protein